MALSPRSTSSVLASMLGTMSVQRLVAALQSLGVVPPRGHSPGRAALIDRLLSDDLVTVAALAPIMRFSELRKACAVCGLETKANRVEVLERRLAGAEAGRAHPD
jgi:hypothetical protein